MPFFGAKSAVSEQANPDDQHQESETNETMLRFLFKSQLSDRNALPFYIALKTPVVCMDRKKKSTK